MHGWTEPRSVTDARCATGFCARETVKSIFRNLFSRGADFAIAARDDSKETQSSELPALGGAAIRRDLRRPQILGAQFPGTQGPDAGLALHVRHLKQHRRRVISALFKSFDHTQSPHRFALHFRAQVKFASPDADVTSFGALREKTPITVEPADLDRELQRSSPRPCS